MFLIMRIFLIVVTLTLSTLVSFLYAQKDQSNTEVGLNKLIDQWHLDAAKPNFFRYFEVTTDDFIFLGTAPGERWNKTQFKQFAKPYFDAGKAWDFKASNRNWVFSENQKIAWFDEDLVTWMNSCRGSGVFVKEGKNWKLAYYNLTVLIENEKIQEFIKLRQN
jgi:hypothetical protein